MVSVGTVTLAAALPAPAPSRAHAAPVAAAQLSDRVANYTIRCEVDVDSHSIRGSEHITWRNAASLPTGELQFHLYLNAFRDERTTFMQESGGQLRGVSMAKGGYGGIEITSLRIAGQSAMSGALEFIQPDDGNPNDSTVARLPLARELQPGESVAVDVEFVSTLPAAFARTGYHGDYMLAGQWFPKLGVYEDSPDGKGAAWNCHQFHANSEFYADFGVYDVEITIPTGYVIGATGTPSEPQATADGRVKHRFVQADVHDFAFAVDSDFVEGRRTVDGVADTPVDIVALVQPIHAATLERHLDAAEASLRWFAANIANYPFSRLTVIDPEVGAEGTGGMEYPTFITIGVDSRNVLPARDDPSLEVTVAHEFSHQFFQGIVASNEFEEAWLDEGLTSYCHQLIADDVWPDHRSAYVGFGGLQFALPFPTIEVGRFVRIAGKPMFVQTGPMLKKSWEYDTFSYVINSYVRPIAAMKTLEGILGRERVLAALRHYVEKWRFRHPRSEDFFRAVSESAGEDLDWFFTQFFRQNTVLDDAVAGVRPGEDGVWLVKLVRREAARVPRRVRVMCADGTSNWLLWPREIDAWEAEVRVSSPVVEVDIDPWRSFWLDANAYNDTYSASNGLVGPARLASGYGVVLEHLVASIAELF
jgi:hypothetical protein